MHRNYLHVDMADGGNSLVAAIQPNGAAASRSLGSNGYSQHVLGHHSSAPLASSTSAPNTTSNGHHGNVLASAAASTLRATQSSPATVPSPDPSLPPRPRRLPGIPATAARRTGPI
jgi:hypothetical protein